MLSKKDQSEKRDLLIVLSSNQTADIATVYEQNDESILAMSNANDYCVPQADVTCYVGSSGRIYAYGAKEELIQETKRLAALEKSIVLRQITNFNEKLIPEEIKKVSLKEILMYLLIGVLVLAVIFK